MEKVKPLILEKKIKDFPFALLSDRIDKKQDRKQKYGTQSICKDGQLVSYPIENPETVNRRRKEVGLDQTLEDYLKGLRDIYGKCNE